MALLPADYALAAFTVIAAVTGLFRGFSGTLAFVIALAGAGAAAGFAWPYSEMFTQTVLIRSAIALVTSLLVFGIIRCIVKKCVNGLLAQPTDSLFGFLTGAAIGVLAVFAWAAAGVFHEYSNIVSAAAAFLK